MTSRERVLTTINHGQPDRIPLVIGVSNATGIKMKPYQGIKKIAGIRPRTITFMTGPNSEPQTVMKKQCFVCAVMFEECLTWSL